MRRGVCIVTLGCLLPWLLAANARASDWSDPSHLKQELAKIESGVGGRIGVAFYDVATKRLAGYRTSERFPMCSTFKWALAAHVLHRVDAHEERLERVVPYGASDLEEYAPVTREHVGEGGMTLTALMAAAVEASDNTAANLLLAASDGPQGLTKYFRTLGDDSTRLDRNEPMMSNCEPGDVRDTTTPAAAVADLRVVLLGTMLSAASRDSLSGWMEGCTTGGNRLRAGLPPKWRVGDKTGSGGHGTTNDVAIAWPPGRQPVLVAAFITGAPAEPQARFEALAAVGRLAGEWIAAGAPAQR